LGDFLKVETKKLNEKIIKDSNWCY